MFAYPVSELLATYIRYLAENLFNKFKTKLQDFLILDFKIKIIIMTRTGLIDFRPINDVKEFLFLFYNLKKFSNLLIKKLGVLFFR